ncbi:MAG: SBBP repeat-containing protein [bacterium]
MSKSIQWLCIMFMLILPSIVPAQEWVARYDGPGNGWDGGNALVVDGAGNVYVTGSSDGVGSLYDYATIKYSSTGVEQWVARYNGPGNGGDEPWAIAIDHSGNVYVTGYSEGSGTGSDYATIKYDSSGVEQWIARYNGPGNIGDKAGAIVVDDSGNVYVTGYSVGAGTGSDYATIKYNSSGVEQWVARYNSPDSSHDSSKGIAIDNSGNIFVGGTSRRSKTDDDYVVVKYNTLGVEQWVTQYNGTGNYRDGARALVIDSESNVYVTGYSVGLGSDDDYATVKYNSSGVEQWVARYDGPISGLDYARAIAVDSSGNVYVAGFSEGSGTEFDYAVAKYDSLGVEQWVARYDGPGNSYDEARKMVIDNAGNSYVTGYSIDSYTHEDYATVKYNASGVEQWVVRYNGPIDRCDDASAIAVDNAGYIYVTGWSRGLDIGFDFATIKYAPVGIEESRIPQIESSKLHATIFSGSLQLPKGKKCRVFDITGRVVEPKKIAPGIYFVEIDGKLVQKMIKVK